MKTKKPTNIKVKFAYESSSNLRSHKDFEGPEFRDLVASIKEKGILEPVIVREKKKGSKEFEIVAGNRRFRAAEKLGLTEIPVVVMELTDPEAREIQIIENLHRKDIHPLEEGQVYRQLVEKAKYDTVSIAVKVGKTEHYIQQRLFLTNLTPAVEKAYRGSKILDGHAALIARLAPDDQTRALKECVSRWGETMSIKELERWIRETLYSALAYQPWLKDKEIAKAVGPCKECPPNVPTLFGEVKEGECTSTKCWAEKMKLYIEHARKINPKLVPVSKEYGASPAGIFGRSNYELISSKKKERCKLAEEAIVAAGQDMGTTFWICKDQKCKKHHYSYSSYEPTEKEKEARKKRSKQEKEARLLSEKKFAAALEKVAWPVNGKILDVLLGLAMYNAHHDTNRRIVKLHGLERKKITSEYGSNYDYTAPIKEIAKNMDHSGKLRLLVELMIGWQWDKASEVAKIAATGTTKVNKKSKKN